MGCIGNKLSNTITILNYLCQYLTWKETTICGIIKGNKKGYLVR